MRVVQLQVVCAVRRRTGQSIGQVEAHMQQNVDTPCAADGRSRLMETIGKQIRDREPCTTCHCMKGTIPRKHE
eukprot:6883606-Prymnesium_polylepis.1